MPEPLKASEVNSKTDPSVTKQYDTETPKEKQISDFYAFVDSQKICLMSTERPGLGPVSRSMAVAKRIGPDFLFLSNIHSRKFEDLESNKTVQLNFHDDSSQTWASVTGTATKTSNSDERIKDLYNPMVGVWFGDLGDGTHDGTANDPRMALIEFKSKYVAYWKSTTSTKLGFLAELGTAAFKGEVAQTGLSRELSEADLENARKQG